MSSISRSSIRRVLYLVIAACAAPIVAFAANSPSNSASATTRPALPPSLRVDGKIILRVHARGFQVYTARKNAAGKIVWVFKAPEAIFRGPRGLSGKHTAGPTWELSDGSKVVGVKIAEAVVKDPENPNAIPWLLLAAKSHEGNGILSAVTFIQRINTAGGTAPAVGVEKEGDEIKIPYVADYIFYGPGATTRPAGK
ncbi:MAG TPA: DUF3455 domain-containing protein [Tepidisphaeraceae bacterium]|jgi:hypothetical protein|nr:DUF3455 domain-containing protein [Tepidisphaeraceae bacterium]